MLQTLKKVCRDWAFGSDAFVTQPRYLANGTVISKEDRPSTHNPQYFAIKCDVGDNVIYVACERQLGSLIEKGTLLPISYQVSKDNGRNLNGQIDFSRLRATFSVEN